jgi:hypothetical protein
MRIIVHGLIMAIIAGVRTVPAQSTETRPATDAEKVADALRAGPDFITKDATLLDWPSTKGGSYRVLRQGSSDWTCLPAVPGYPHDEPMCLDRTFMDWVKQSLAGQEPHIDKLGIAYMYVGAFVPNKSKTQTANPEFHFGPHVMIITPHQDELQGFSRDGSNGMPYLNTLPHGTQAFLVMPFQQASQRWSTHGLSWVRWLGASRPPTPW